VTQKTRLQAASLKEDTASAKLEQLIRNATLTAKKSLDAGKENAAQNKGKNVKNSALPRLHQSLV